MMQQIENRLPGLRNGGEGLRNGGEALRNGGEALRRAPDRQRTVSSGDRFGADCGFGGPVQQNSQGRPNRPTDSTDASLLIISDFKTKEIKVTHQWKIPDFAGVAQACIGNWSKLDPQESSFYHFGAPVEVFVNFDTQLNEQQQENGGAVVFVGERFATSKMSEIADCTWQVAVYPACPLMKANMSRGYNPFEIAEFGEYIAVYLHMKSSSQAAVHKPAFLGTLDLKVNVSLLNGKGDVLVTQSSDLFTQNVINRRIGFDKFIKREEVLCAGSPYITDGALSFRVEVDVFYRGSEVAVSLSNPPPAWLTPSQLQMLRTSGLDYDVIVVGSDGLFNCHQAFLSERCGMFEEFFRSPELKAILATSSTAHPQRISIAGVDPVLVSELVRFAYTDEITPKPHLAEKLLVIAHKHKTLGLKDLCEDILISGLDALNAAELHQLANECEADKLKYQTLQLLCCLNAEDGKPGFPIVPAVIALNPEATVLYATGNAPSADEP